MLTIMPWMLGWVGLIQTCSAAATCVWSAYGLHPSHFDCLHQEWSNSHAWMAQGVRRLFFDPVGAHLIPSRGGRFVPSTVCPPGSIRWVVNPLGGQFIRWLIQLCQTLWWTIRKWRDQPYAIKVGLSLDRSCQIIWTSLDPSGSGRLQRIHPDL